MAFFDRKLRNFAGFTPSPGVCGVRGFTPSSGVCGLRGFTPSPGVCGLPGFTPQGLRAAGRQPFIGGLRAAGLHPFTGNCGLLGSVALRVGGPCLLPMSDAMMKLPSRTSERPLFMTEAILGVSASISSKSSHSQICGLASTRTGPELDADNRNTGVQSWDRRPPWPQRAW